VTGYGNDEREEVIIRRLKTLIDNGIVYVRKETAKKQGVRAEFKTIYQKYQLPQMARLVLNVDKSIKVKENGVGLVNIVNACKWKSLVGTKR